MTDVWGQDCVAAMAAGHYQPSESALAVVSYVQSRLARRQINCMKSKSTVTYSTRVEKQLNRLPRYIAESLKHWAAMVEEKGIRQARLVSGFHDEPLWGSRRGQRSIRLNRSYRAFYVEIADLQNILVIEVNKHEY